MTQTAPGEPMANAALKAGLIAGLLDATAASVQYYINTGSNPAKVFRYVASAAFGEGIKSENLYQWAMVGLVLHFLIAISFAFFFFFIYKHIKKLIPNTIVAGVLYGLFVWCVMNLVVVPLSFGQPVKIVPEKAAIAAGILIAAIGIPVSLLANRYYSNKV